MTEQQARQVTALECSRSVGREPELVSYAMALLIALSGVSARSALASEYAHAGEEKGSLVPIKVSRQAMESVHAPRRVALLIGVSQFDDREWRKLRYPTKDVADFASVLSDPQRGAFTRVETLPQASREAIREALQKLAVGQDERDLVVVYFSSHGTLARDARGTMRRYLVTRDTRMADIPGTALSMDELKTLFDAMPSRRKVLVLAACHSGGGKSLLPSDVQRELEGVKAGFFVRPIEEVSRASVVLAAADWGETAREDEKLENDIYTHYLIEALQKGADRNGDGAVTASEAHDYARRMTYDYTGGRQRPSAEISEVGADPTVLVGQVRRKGRPELYSYAPSLDGFTVRVNGETQAMLPGGLAMESGRYRLQVAKGDGPAVLDVPISLSPGERIDIEDLMARSEPRWEIAPRIALLGFLDDRSRREILKPVLGAGATLSVREWPARRMLFRFDVIGSTGRSSYQQGPTTARLSYTALTAGAAVAWRFPLNAAPGLAFLAGPRLSGVYLARRFDRQLAGAPQSYLVMTPGVLMGAGWELSSRFTLGAELQLDWMLLRVDGQDRSSGFGELLFGAGYRF